MDPRPNTRYSIFIVAYNKQIKGRPSNMKTVTTREDGEPCHTLLGKINFFL
jgi:hypothetical protein